MPVPQNHKNHTRLDPRFHFLVAPVLLLNVLVAIILAVRYWQPLHWLGIWIVVMGVALFMTAGLARDYGLRNQDRLIRLEERLRYASLLSPAEIAATEALSLRQVIALRFASDGELATLATRAAKQGLSSTQIKQSIQVWRPDTSRV